jgi:structural maintenance of chromosome 2
MDLREDLAERGAALEQCEAAAEAAKAEVAGRTEELQQKERRLQAINAGVADDEGGEAGTAEQLRNEQAMLSELAAVDKNSAMRVKHLAAEAKKQEKEVKKAEKDRAALDGDLGKAQKKLAKSEGALAELKGVYDPEREEALREEESTLVKQRTTLKRQVDAAEAKLGAKLQFEYKDPVRGFDRSKVKGIVADLIHVNDPATATALEVTAGGKLFQVIVDTEATGKQLLQKGKLKKRVTIVPLNKVRGNVLDAARVRAAQEVGGGADQVKLALSMVGYADELEGAMRHVFGSTLVCLDADTAERVTFDKRVEAKCVTMSGDVFDPRGTMSGGSARRSAPILLSLAEAQQLRGELAAAETRLHAVVDELRAMEAHGEQYAQLASDAELHGHQVTLLQDRIGQSKHARLMGELEATRASLEEAQAAGAEARGKLGAVKARVKQLQAEIKNHAKEMEKKKKEGGKLIAEAKKALKAAEKSLADVGRDAQTAQLETEQLQVDLDAVGKELGKRTEALETASGKAAALKVQVDEKLEEYKALKGELDAIKQALKDGDKSIRDMSKKRDKVSSRCEKCEVEAKKIANKLKSFDKEQTHLHAQIDMLEKKHAWIPSEKVRCVNGEIVALPWLYMVGCSPSNTPTRHLSTDTHVVAHTRCTHAVHTRGAHTRLHTRVALNK